MSYPWPGPYPWAGSVPGAPAYPYGPSLEVSIADLAAAALAVTGVGEDLAGAFADADGRCAAASPGWQGLSASALSVVAQRWADDGAALLARLREFSAAVGECALAFAETEQSRAGAFDPP